MGGIAPSDRYQFGDIQDPLSAEDHMAIDLKVVRTTMHNRPMTIL